MRTPGWRGRLEEYLGRTAREPFGYGRNDCALWVAGAVEAMTGEDPAAEVRGRYTTLDGGLRAVRRSGRVDHVDIASELFEEISPAFAGVGDVAAVPGDGMIALGIVGGPHIHVLRLDGMGVVPLTDAVRAWRV